MSQSKKVVSEPKSEKVGALDVVKDSITNYLEAMNCGASVSDETINNLVNSVDSTKKECSISFLKGRAMGVAKNYVSNRAYLSGATQFIMMLSTWMAPELKGVKRSGYYVTTKQAAELGWKIRDEFSNISEQVRKLFVQIKKIRSDLKLLEKNKDEEGIKELKEKLNELLKEYCELNVAFPVLYFSNFTKKVLVRDENGEPVLDENGEKQYTEEETLVARYYVVYPIEVYDTSSHEIKGRYKPEDENENEQIGETSDGWNVLNAYYEREGIKVVRKDAARACYSLKDDSITLPLLKRFDDEEDALLTSAHESVHSTGNKNRLHRFDDFIGGREEYSEEELVAEWGSVLFGSKFGSLTTKAVENALAYIKGYLKSCVGDKKNHIVKALNNAFRAVNYIIGKQEDVQEENEIAKGE